MQTPHLPINEQERVAALRAAKILDTPAEEVFDRITRLVAHTLQVPIALISLVDSNRQWFKSKVGVDVEETSRDISFCGHALLGSSEFVVTDALNDPRFDDNPLVTGEANIRFYAGIPLLSAEGFAMGTLCSIDHIPREITEAELVILRELAKIAEELIQRRQLAFSTKDLLQSLQERETRYKTLVEHSPDAFLINTGGFFTFANDAALRLLGADSKELIIGRRVLDIVAPEFIDIVKRRIQKVTRLGTASPMMELEWLKLDGTRIDVEVASIPFEQGDEKAIQVIARDISERKREKSELIRLATNDILTGLPNRTLLMDRLRQGISRWERHQHKSVIAFIGLDRFTHLNDTFGSGIGDQVLAAMGKSLQTLLRQSDTAARMGGDEFILVLEDIQDEEMPPQILRRIFEHISQPLWLGTQEINVASSIGFSLFPSDGNDPDTLLSSANAAMHRAKNLGRGNIQQYSQHMRTQANERFTLENQLKHAVDNNELVLHYQPKVDLPSGAIVGVEALIRWQHPQLGLVSPARFIPIAEESGLIVPIGEWIIKTACAQINMWKEKHAVHVPIAINLSSLQFLQQDIVGCVRSAAYTYNVDPCLLEFELTESMSMGNPENSIAIMRDFKMLGTSLSIDDFGTGYSNLSHLKRFPVDKLKIDQSFVADMTSGAESLAIVQAIIAMAHALKLIVVAEGVETKEQLELLIQNKCDQVQGYYFSRPLNADECIELICVTQNKTQVG